MKLGIIVIAVFATLFVGLVFAPTTITYERPSDAYAGCVASAHQATRYHSEDALATNLKVCDEL